MSPLGIVPKKVRNKFRLIHHISYPNGSSANDGIAPEHSSVSYTAADDAVEWIARQKLIIKIDHILHLLDDFLMAALSKELCQTYVDLFLTLCSYLGIPIAPEKTMGPSTIICFAGIELDSMSMEARLPLDRMGKCILTTLD